MERIEGWESRLAGVVEEARNTPYTLGGHDCFRFACACVKSLTGVDLWAPWAGKYDSKIGALRLLAEYGGDFTGSFSKLFGVEPVSIKLARRGDVLEYVATDGQQHLAVCVGAEAAVLGESGLMFIPFTDCKHAWSIG